MSGPGKPGSKERLDWMTEKGMLRSSENDVDLTESAKSLEEAVDEQILSEVERMASTRAFASGDIVFFDHAYGRVSSITSFWNPKAMAMDWLYTVKKIDPKTGEAMKCPDERCTEACVICSRSLWADQLRPITKTDEAFYRKEGMLK